MTRTTLRLLTVGLVLGCSLQPSRTVAGQEAAAPPPTFARVPKFAIETSPITISGDVRPHQYLGVVGPQAAWLGTETGAAELWVHPLKLVTGFALDFRIPDYTDPVRGADVARRVDIRPEMTTITYSHATFTVRQHILVPLDEPGVLVLLDVDAVHPLEIIASFRNVFQYAWPGAFGGQYASWDEPKHAFLLSESLRRRNGYLGSPWATTASNHPAHALPDAPSVFRIPVDPGRATREFIPIVAVAGTASRDELFARYQAMIARAESLYRARVAHAAQLRTSAVAIDSPDDRLDLAFEWAKVNLDEQRVCNPDLGCGPVAGWAPSGQSLRPGFGWFFGGDAAINSLAMSSAGMHDLVAEGLRFFAKYQRADGKITHEISQSAGQLPWFTEFPYTYYHADTTPYWIAAVWQHWRATGDTALLDELWPALKKAWAWCLTTETDGDGIIENTTGGLGAIEVGAIGESIHQDVYLAAVWILAIDAMRELASARGESALAGQAATLREQAGRTLNEKYWIEGAGHHAFGLLASGKTNDALTVWPATAAAFGEFDRARANQTLAALASHRLTADWGARMLADDHPLYEPLHYNMGAVWPFVTGFVALGHYRYERPWAGYPLVDAMAQLTFNFARGRHAELLSGAFYRPLDTAVPHQFFATSMLATPLLRGLVGWTADAPRHAARLAPQLPPAWDHLDVRRLSVGDSRLDVRIVQAAGTVTTTLAASGPPITLEYVPSLPAGARDVTTAVVEGGRGQVLKNAIKKDVTPLVVGAVPVTVTTTWRGGYAIDPPVATLEVGQRSSGVRVLDVVAGDRTVRIDVEGMSGTSVEIGVHGERPVSVDEGEVVEWAGTRGRVKVTFAAGASATARRTVTLHAR